MYKPLIAREGLPNKWTFDRGTENRVVAFAIQLLVQLYYVNMFTIMAVVAIVGSRRQCRIERFWGEVGRPRRDGMNARPRLGLSCAPPLSPLAALSPSPSADQQPASALAASSTTTASRT